MKIYTQLCRPSTKSVRIKDKYKKRVSQIEVPNKYKRNHFLFCKTLEELYNTINLSQSELLLEFSLNLTFNGKPINGQSKLFPTIFHRKALPYMYISPGIDTIESAETYETKIDRPTVNGCISRDAIKKSSLVIFFLWPKKTPIPSDNNNSSINIAQSSPLIFKNSLFFEFNWVLWLELVHKISNKISGRIYLPLMILISYYCYIIFINKYKSLRKRSNPFFVRRKFIFSNIWSISAIIYTVLVKRFSQEFDI